MQIEKLREIFPELRDDDLRIAAENLDRYLEIAWEIFEESQPAEDAP